MKKILALFILSFLFLLPMAPAMANDGFSFGQKHNYSVTFRGNGEAHVMARISFTNFSESVLRTLKFKTNDTFYEVFALQQILTKTCTKQVYNNETKSYDCQNYTEADYYNSSNNYNYYQSTKNSSEYHKLQFTETNREYEFKLLKPLLPNEQGAIFISYYTKDYVEAKAGGLFDFNFKSLKTPVRISEINVAVDVGSELYMRGQTSIVNYNNSFNEVGLGMATATTAGFSNPTLDKASSQVGLLGVVNKQAKSLAPNEEFIVKGSYATSKLRLNLVRGILFFLVLIIVITGIYFLNKYVSGKKKDTLKFNESNNTLETSTNKDTKITLSNGKYLLWGSVSSLIIFGLTYLIQYIGESRILRDLFKNMEFMYAIGFILLILMYVFLIFGVPLIFASKRGWKAFISVFITTLISSSIIFALVVIFISIT
jgi:hypothetical protein